MIDLKKIEQYAKEGKGLTAKEAMSLLEISDYRTLKTKVDKGIIDCYVVSGDTYYRFRYPQKISVD